LTKLRRVRSLPLLALALVVAATTACGKSRRLPPIVVVSIDTLRADRLPAYGYAGGSTPAIDALARDAVRFENAYAHYPLTLPSHLSMLTGLLPPEHGVRDNVGYRFDGASHETLAALLGGSGYATGGFVSSFVLRAKTGIDHGFSTYDEPEAPRRGAPLDAAQRPASATLERAAAWLRGVAADEDSRPPFLFLHFYEPHAPYAPPEPYRSRLADAYDGEVAAADAAVGELTALLRELGLYDDAVVVLVSDHGEGLGDHGEQQHGVFLYRSTLHVPLLVKLPRAERAGASVADPVGLVDLFPTLARLARARTERDGSGRDLLTAAPERSPRSLYAETYYPRLHFGWSDLQAMIESRWYLIRGPQPELFDLAADPGQTRDVLAAERREYARLAAEIERRNTPLADPVQVDAETARNLAALGYLSAGAAVSRAELPDPKTQRHLLQAIESGLVAFWSDRFDESIEQFGRALAENPRMSDLWAYRARALDRLGRPREALQAWETVLELSGGSGPVALTVAERYLQLGELERAASVARSVERLDPSGATDLLIEVDVASGDRAAAERRMRDAVSRGVASELVRRQLALAELQAGRPIEALAILPGTIPLAPPGRILRSLALADTGRAAEANDELERARRESEVPADFFEHLGTALMSLDRVEKARAALAESVRLDPRRAQAWNVLGVARLRLEGPQAAVDAWRRALEIDPRLADAWFNVGLVASGGGDRALARRAFRSFLETSLPAATAQRRRAEEELRRLGAG
jgi:arylsulfatase A-like enzyme/Tfp pilus assembly protein PilF